MMRPADLRLRLLFALGALLLFTPVRHLAPAVSGVLVVLSLYAVYRQAIPWRRLLHLEGFLVLLLVTLPFTIPGTELFHVGPLTASVEGLWRAVILACKVTASVLLISLLFSRCDPLHFGIALRGLYVPESLVRLFISVVRYLAMIQPEFSRLRESMRMRAFRPRSNWHTWRSYGYLLGMLLVRAMERAERVEEAMRLRGYAGRIPRVPLPRPDGMDWWAGVCLMGGAGLIFLWDVVWRL